MKWIESKKNQLDSVRIWTPGNWRICRHCVVIPVNVDKAIKLTWRSTVHPTARRLTWSPAYEWSFLELVWPKKLFSQREDNYWFDHLIRNFRDEKLDFINPIIILLIGLLFIYFNNVITPIISFVLMVDSQSFWNYRNNYTNIERRHLYILMSIVLV